MMKKRLIFILALICTLFNSIVAQTAKTPGVAKQIAKSPGKFIEIKSGNASFRGFVAGPENAVFAVIVVHDYLGITESTKQAVEHLGALGYRSLAVDLYKGKSATTDDSAVELMKAKNPEETKNILEAAIEYLYKPGRKLASLGFSAGGIDALNVNLLAPDKFKATAVVYAGDYDKLDKEKIDKLQSPFLAITGSLDNWPLDAALNFLKTYKDKSFEFYVYPGADHGYAQPLFNGGKNYNPTAIRVTWMLLEDFLKRNLK